LAPIEHGCKIRDLRLARAVFHHRLAICQHGCHQQVLRAGHGDLVEENMRALQPIGLRFQITMFLRDGGAHCLQALDVQVNRAAADCATAGHGNACEPRAGDQWAKHQ
jgi:hypothetical protein